MAITARKPYPLTKPTTSLFLQTKSLTLAIAPGLIFQALALTQVNNVVLVGRLEPPLTLALSVWLLRERAIVGRTIWGWQRDFSWDLSQPDWDSSAGGSDRNRGS